jgi:4'-phosphopantetheinyl transferase
MDLTADSRRIDLWCTYISDIGDPSILSRYDALLSPNERTTQARFLFAKDQRRYLVTRALVRTVLSRYAAVRPEEWVFSAGLHGRPAISAPKTAVPLEFNVAHSGDLVIVGVTSGRTLGIDAECMETRTFDLEGLPRYFAPEERAAMLRLPPDQRHRRFFELWTLKESYIKARGKGLTIRLDSFRFVMTGKRGLSLHMRRGFGDSRTRWRLWQVDLRPDYLAAVCAARGGARPPRLVAREVVPLESEQLVDVTVSRATG